MATPSPTPKPTPSLTPTATPKPTPTPTATPSPTPNVQGSKSKKTAVYDPNKPYPSRAFIGYDSLVPANEVDNSYINSPFVQKMNKNIVDMYFPVDQNDSFKNWKLAADGQYIPFQVVGQQQYGQQQPQQYNNSLVPTAGAPAGVQTPVLPKGALTDGYLYQDLGYNAGQGMLNSQQRLAFQNILNNALGNVSRTSNFQAPNMTMAQIAQTLGTPTGMGTITKENQAPLAAAKKYMMGSPAQLDEEIKRTQNVITARTAAGMPVVDQNKYLQTLQGQQAKLKGNLGLINPDEQASFLGQQRFNQQQDLMKQQENVLTTERDRQLKQQQDRLEAAQQALPAKSFLRMRQAFQNLANRGMLSSGLNWLAMNQESAKFNEENARTMEKFADAITNIEDKFGTRIDNLKTKYEGKDLKYYVDKANEELKKGEEADWDKIKTISQVLNNYDKGTVDATKLAFAGANAQGAAMKSAKTAGEITGNISTSSGQTLTSGGRPIATYKAQQDQIKNNLAAVKVNQSAERIRQNGQRISMQANYKPYELSLKVANLQTNLAKFTTGEGNKADLQQMRTLGGILNSMPKNADGTVVESFKPLFEETAGKIDALRVNVENRNKAFSSTNPIPTNVK